MKLSITTLGCDKNTCDSEVLAGALRAQRYKLVARDEDADIIVVNTCAFIRSARDEAVRVIKSKLEKNANAKVVVTGCLTKYPKLIPAGVEVWPIGEVGIASSGALHPPRNDVRKLLSTPPSYAYIKISDGCDNRCTYCTIPSIRGSYKPRAMAEIIDEVAHFAGLGVGEFILVAQDLTKYTNTPSRSACHPSTQRGLPLAKGLITLIRKISKIQGVRRIRLHYVYPSGITDELVREIVCNKKICKYLDVPFQHISPRILQLMNRKPCDCFALVKRLQSLGITIRSTFMVGFPTESEAEFNDLCDFLRVACLDYVGFFKYSRERGTPSFSMEQVDAKTKTARLRVLQNLQKGILAEKHQNLVGQIQKVTCDFYDSVLRYSVTRSEHQSPDVDPIIIVHKKIKVGEYVDVKIVGTLAENLIGEIV